MIAAYLKQLFYVAEKRSFAFIARQVNLPYRNVLALREGKLTVSADLQNTIRNLYRREAYARLRDVGMSYHQARRFSTYGVEAVRLRSQSLKLKIAELATGATASKIREAAKKGLVIDVDKTFDEMYGLVQEGIKTSPEPYEKIMDY